MPHMANLNWIILYFLIYSTTIIYYINMTYLSLIFKEDETHKINKILKNNKNTWKW